LRRIVVCTLLVCASSSCSEQGSVPTYVGRGESAGVLGFVRAGDGWMLLRCERERDLQAYRHDEERQAGEVPCRTALPRTFTTAELAAAQQRIAADLQRGAGDRVAQISFSVTLAALSLLLSRAIVADVKKVVPITLAVGFILYHAYRRVQQIVSMQRGKETALAELRAPETRHNSDTSLSAVEEVLLSYLTSASPPS